MQSSSYPNIVYLTSNPAPTQTTISPSWAAPLQKERKSLCCTPPTPSPTATLRSFSGFFGKLS